MTTRSSLMPVATGNVLPDVEARLLRGLLIAARSDAPMQDLIDCAELALTGGSSDTAAMLYGLVALQLGASPVTSTLLGEANARAGWWTLADTPVRSREPGFAIDLAIGELRELLALEPMLAPTPERIDEVLPAEARMGTPPLMELAPALLLLARQSAAILRSVPVALQHGKLHELLRPLPATMFALQPVRIEAHLGLELPLLAELFALERLRDFVVRNGELLNAHSQPALLDRVARLDAGALGPYFSNVRMLLRNGRDFLGLIDAAAGGQAADEELERWSLLLSSHLRPNEVAELADELGDRNMVRALRGILIRLARTSDGERPLDAARRIRDAGLDLGDLQLGADAQRLIVRWRRTDADEWQVLGAIQATQGQPERAEVSLEQALFLDRDHADARTGLGLLKAGKPYLVDRGIDSSPARRRIRLARAEAFRRRTGC